ncbi:hypothetical protein CRYUN_Cryun01aG0237700 [Craigia yunnanensis]
MVSFEPAGEWNGSPFFLGGEKVFINRKEKPKRFKRKWADIEDIDGDDLRDLIDGWLASYDEAASAVIKESVEPLLEEYRPTGITSLKFTKLSLGTVAPKCEGIHVQSLKKGQITMDIDLRWGGDPSIVLGVEAALVASIPIQDLQVFTVIRVIFQLAEEIPCISAVVVALLSERRIDYTLKAVGGSLTAIPGISDMIDWPHRIVVSIGGIPVDTSELELKPEGKSDLYVVVHIRPLFKVKTKVIENNLYPVWNQTFELIAEDRETQALTVELIYAMLITTSNRFSTRTLGKTRSGIATFRLIELEPEIPKEMGWACAGICAGVGLVGTGIGAEVG